MSDKVVSQGKGTWVPATVINNETWYLLNNHGHKHTFRYITGKSPKRVHDPSGHGLYEVNVEGSVKWKPKDPSKLNLINIPPLGAAR